MKLVFEKFHSFFLIFHLKPFKITAALPGTSCNAWRQCSGDTDSSNAGQSLSLNLPHWAEFFLLESHSNGRDGTDLGQTSDKSLLQDPVQLRTGLYWVDSKYSNIFMELHIFPPYRVVWKLCAELWQRDPDVSREYHQYSFQHFDWLASLCW